MLEKLDLCSIAVSATDFQASVELLQSHVNNKRNYSGNQYIFCQGAHLEVDWHSQNRRREYFSDCVFKKSNMTETGFTGGIFNKTTFENCDMSFTNLNSCNFKSCSWIDDRSEFQMGTNFSQSTFQNCTMENMWLQGGNFSNSWFVDSKFSHCRFRSAQFEGAIFEKTVFDHARFGKMNFEFVHFRNIVCNDVTLPFPSIPYIFGGIEYLLKTSDNVRVTSAMSENRKISKEEYLKLLPVLATYYTGTSSYFPLANILLSQNEYEKAKNIVLAGISQSLYLRNYNLLIHLCELIAENALLSGRECIDLYSDIWLSTKTQNLSHGDFCLLNNTMQKIEKVLLTFNQSKVSFILQTNIRSSDTSKASIILEELERFSVLCDSKAKNRIELRHCSPYEIFITVWTGIENIAPYIGLFYCMFLGADKLYNKVIDTISKSQSVVMSEIEKKKTNLEIESLKLANEAQKLDIAIKKEELRRLREESKKTYERITEAGIIICSASHNVTEESAISVPHDLRTERMTIKSD